MGDYIAWTALGDVPRGAIGSYRNSYGYSFCILGCLSKGGVLLNQITGPFNIYPLGLWIDVHASLFSLRLLSA